MKKKKKRSPPVTRVMWLPIHNCLGCRDHEAKALKQLEVMDKLRKHNCELNRLLVLSENHLQDSRAIIRAVETAATRFEAQAEAYAKVLKVYEAPVIPQRPNLQPKIDHQLTKVSDGYLGEDDGEVD
jgi:hypothetical protein